MVDNTVVSRFILNLVSLIRLRFVFPFFSEQKHYSISKYLTEILKPKFQQIALKQIVSLGI